MSMISGWPPVTSPPSRTEEDLRTEALDKAVELYRCDSFLWDGTIFDLAEKLYKFLKNGKVPK